MGALYAFIRNCYPLHSTIIVNRLVKAVLAALTLILPTASDVRSATDNAQAFKSKKGKKRKKGYEGDELFKASRDVVLPLVIDGQLVLRACDGMNVCSLKLRYAHISAALLILMRNPGLSSKTRSVSSRVLLSLLLHLPQITPLSLSSDPTFHGQLLSKIERLCSESASGTTSSMGRSLGLVLSTMTDSVNDVSDRFQDEKCTKC